MSSGKLFTSVSNVFGNSKLNHNFMSKEAFRMCQFSKISDKQSSQGLRHLQVTFRALVS